MGSADDSTQIMAIPFFCVCKCKKCKVSVPSESKSFRFNIFYVSQEKKQGESEFMVEILRVGTTHYNNQLLYRNLWAQVRRFEVQTIEDQFSFFYFKTSHYYHTIPMLFFLYLSETFQDSTRRKLFFEIFRYEIFYTRNF